LKRLGASCDWSRERFTMDEGLSRAVVKVFVELHREGLIYKDKRLVNWDPKLLTAISDLEVQQIEVKGSLWYLRYPIEGKNFSPDDPSTFVVVATDAARDDARRHRRCDHPDNERIGHLIGQHVILPLVGRRIPIIGDDYADPERDRARSRSRRRTTSTTSRSASGMACRRINVFDQRGLPGPRRQRGLSARLAGRRAEAGGRAAQRRPLRRAQDDRGAAGGFRLPGEGRAEHAYGAARRSLRRGHRALSDRPVVCRRQDHGAAGDRGRALGRDHVRAEELGKDLLRMDGKHPALVHLASALVGSTRFPHGTDPTARCSSPRPKRKPSATRSAITSSRKSSRKSRGARWRRTLPSARAFITRDEDVLDTWFSSGLWPFSTLGWPDETPEVKRYYPTNVLVTGWDIIFFWVARMMMMGLHFMKDAPFSTVYIHRLVRDEKGAKMSKSKGNVIDPLGVIDDFRRGRAALCAGARRGPQPRHQAVAATRRNQSQFRDQAVERLPLRRDERLRAARRLRSDGGKGNLEPLDRA
jgi:valyl-tRNA synthetase